MLFSASVFGSQTRDQALGILTNSNRAVLTFFEHFSLGLSFCLCLDVCLTIKDPFKKQEQRIVPYFGSVFVFSLFSSVLTIDLHRPIFGKSTTHILLDVAPSVTVVYLSIYMLVAVLSCTLMMTTYTRVLPSQTAFIHSPRASAVKILRNRSLPRNLVCRHVSLTVPFIVTWSPYLALAYLELALPRDMIAPSSQGWIAAYDLMSVAVGIVVSVVCILEPSFLRALRMSLSSDSRDNSYREQL